MIRIPVSHCIQEKEKYPDLEYEIRSAALKSLKKNTCESQANKILTIFQTNRLGFPLQLHEK